MSTSGDRRVQNIELRARADWPHVSLSSRSFRRHLDHLEIEVSDLAAHGSDVFLVAAVLDGCPRAMAAVDQAVTEACAIAARVDGAPEFVDDVRRELRTQLLSGPAPRLASFTGRSALGEWLRVGAVRVALTRKRTDALGPGRDPPVRDFVATGSHAAASEEAFALLEPLVEEAFGRLEPRERVLLRLHFCDGLATDRIGIIYGVHRVTVARWLARIRQKLLKHAHAALSERHDIRMAEVRGLYRAMEGEVTRTLSRSLGD